MYVCDLAHTTGVLLDCNQIRVLRQSLRLLRSRQLDVQDTILELCVDVFLLHIAHVETARAGAGEGFAPQIVRQFAFRHTIHGQNPVDNW